MASVVSVVTAVCKTLVSVGCSSLAVRCRWHVASAYGAWVGWRTHPQLSPTLQARPGCLQDSDGSGTATPLCTAQCLAGTWTTGNTLVHNRYCNLYKLFS